MLLKRFRAIAIGVGLFILNASLIIAADGPSLNPTGRPKAFEKGKHTTVAVWEDDGVWHIRTSVKPGPNGKDQRVQFTGLVTIKGDTVINGEFQGLEKKAKAQEADWVILHKDKRGFDFQFSTTTNNVDGVNFKLGPKAESVTFRITVAGDDDPKRIIIGTKGVHPPKAEFTFPATMSKP